MPPGRDGTRTYAVLDGWRDGRAEGSRRRASTAKDHATAPPSCGTNGTYFSEMRRETEIK
jgi:hypothetical protein